MELKLSDGSTQPRRCQPGVRPDVLRALELIDYDLDSGIPAADEVTSLLDTTAADAIVVAKRGEELAKLTGIADRQKLLRWVMLVRPELLRRHAYEMNRADDHMGGSKNWIAVGGMVVGEGGAVHRDLLARSPRPSRAVARPLVRVRTRGRTRRTRRQATRSRARSPGRQADSDPEPEPPLTRGATPVSGVPRLVVEVPIEGRASARVVCSTFEEELRVGVELLSRDVLGELVNALAGLYDVLADRAAEHEGGARGVSDYAQASRWIDRVWGDRDFGDRTGHFFFAFGVDGRYDERGKYKHKSWQERHGRWPDDVDRFMEEALERAKTDDVYVAPYLRSNASRKKGSALASNVLYADIDQLDPSVNGFESQLIGPGGLLVNSGRGRHVYLSLSVDLDPAELERLNRQLARYLHADAGWAENKVLRLPGTFNHKGRARGGDPLPVLILDGPRAERNWTPDELLELFGPEPENLPTLDIEPVMPTNVPKHLAVRLDEEPNEQPGRQTFGFVGACVDAGLSDEEVLALGLLYQPAIVKYGRTKRLREDVERSLRKHRAAADAGASPSGTHLGTHPVENASAEVPGESPDLGASRASPTLVGTHLGRDAPHPFEREDAPTAPGASPDPDAPHAIVFEFEIAADFAAEDEPSAEMLLGYDVDDAAATANGTLIIYGGGGAGKSTMALDATVRMAVGEDWLGDLRAPRPVRTLIVENDGPRGRFRRKVRAKLAAWQGDPPGDRLVVLKSPWGETSLARADHRAELAEYIRSHDVDLLLAGPIVSLGMIGGGTPDEVSAFEQHLAALRDLVGRPLAVWLIHHQNVRGQISGAWDRVPDTLIRIVAAGNGQTRLIWEKTRDSSTLHQTSWKLKWAAGMSFEMDTTPDVTEADIEAGIIEFVAANPGASWNAVDKAVKRGKAATKRQVRDRLIADGELVNRSKGKTFVLWVADDPELDGEQTVIEEDDR